MICRMDNTSTKRLAKNTIMMYIRMGITMITSLITARVLLDVLGVEDYGLYNAVSGIVVLINFLNNALTLTSQRYFSYALGEGDLLKLRDVFNATFIIYLNVAVLLIIIGETVGLWFLNGKMVFPEGKVTLANFVFQFSLLITALNIMRTPFSSIFIASEKLDFFATSSIVESVLHLGFVFLLLIVPYNPSFVYIVFQTTLALFMLLWFVWYFNCYYSDVIKFSRVQNKGIYKELTSFSGWGIFGSIAVVGFQQGVNILLNMFFGVTINAAFGIANRVCAMVNQFFSGFQTAANPQITKAQAIGDVVAQQNLIIRTSKISYLLLMFVGVIVTYNIDYLLEVWLNSVPDHTASLCSLMIVGAMIDALSAPLYVTIFATGKIKWYQLVISLVLLLNIVFSYLAFKLGAGVESCIYIRILLFVISYIIRLLFVRAYTEVRVDVIFKEVIVPLMVITSIIGAALYSVWYVKNSLVRLLLVTPFLVVFMVVTMYVFGLECAEKQMVKLFLKQRIFKYIK